MWNNPDTEIQIPYDLPQICNLEEKVKLTEAVSRNELPGTRGWGLREDIVERIQTFSYELNKYHGTTLQCGVYG
jgi:hypothetical protein